MIPALESIPEHLKEYITEQDPDLYTFIDHASWRYIMRVSKAFFSKHGHSLYLHGLEATGVSIEKIPLVHHMDRVLRKLGWRAVVINGFIPPSIFLEFQSLRILAIACDMRKLENLGYTPSPDIVHEAAGHAPIVADPDYRAYLEAYGEVARNAIISKYDMDLYHAIFRLSEAKEDPASSPTEVAQAQREFELMVSQENEPSEAALLARMAWWTTEYGLLGPIEKPLIYGAGLLSSVEESYNSIQPTVKKIPFSLKACIETSYDITRPQPQLFVAKDFSELTRALDEFANSMAFRQGGLASLEKGLEAQNTVTTVLDNGIQISGILQDVGIHETAPDNQQEEEIYFIVGGAKQVAFTSIASKELQHYHLPSKIFVPLFEKNVAAAPTEDLQRKLHGSGLHSKGGLRIQGNVRKEVIIAGAVRALILKKLRITNTEGKVIFEERQKEHPLFLGTRVTSVFGGAADRKEFTLRGGIRAKVASHKTNLTPENEELNGLYRVVREFREGKAEVDALKDVAEVLKRQYPKDWLLRLELLEIAEKYPEMRITAALLRKDLMALKTAEPGLQNLIQRGMELL